jgi:branched-chain amino acid transport system substrate-binding protein
MKDNSLVWWLIGVALIAGLGYLVLRQKPTQPNIDTQAPPTAGPAATEDPTFDGEVAIGMVLPLSGDHSPDGVAAQAAAQFAADQINKDGGLGGKKLVLAVEDGKCAAASAATAGKLLIETRGVQAIIGGVCSEELVGLGPVMREKKSLALAPFSATPQVTTDAGPFTYRFYPEPLLAGKAAARYALNEFQAKSVALLYEDTSYGRGMTTAFTTHFKQFGGKVVMDEAFDKGLVTFRSQAAQVKNVKADVVYIVPETASSGIAILQALQGQGIKSRVLTNEVLLNATLVGSNKALLEGVVGFAPTVDEKAPAFLSFAQAYQEARGESLTQPFEQATTYSLVYLLKGLMEDRGLVSELIKPGLDSLKNWTGGALSGVSLNGTGDLMWKTFDVNIGREGAVVTADTIEIE